MNIPNEKQFVCFYDAEYDWVSVRELNDYNPTIEEYLEYNPSYVQVSQPFTVPLFSNPEKQEQVIKAQLDLIADKEKKARAEFEQLMNQLEGRRQSLLAIGHDGDANES